MHNHRICFVEISEKNNGERAWYLFGNNLFDFKAIFSLPYKSLQTIAFATFSPNQLFNKEGEEVASLGYYPHCFKISEMMNYHIYY